MCWFTRHCTNYCKKNVLLMTKTGILRPRGGRVLFSRADPPLSVPSHAASLHSTSSAAGAPLRRFHDMIVNSARDFIPISDLFVTVKTGDIPGDGSSRGQDTDNGDTGACS